MVTGVIVGGILVTAATLGHHPPNPTTQALQTSAGGPKDVAWPHPGSGTHTVHMPDGDRTPSPVTLTAFHLLRQGLSAEEVRERTGLPLALVELIAADGSGRQGAAAVYQRDAARRHRGRVITTAIAALAVASFIGALASVMMHIPTLGIASACCTAMSLLAVHLYTRPTR